jgi:hypothetical protein
MDAPVPAPIRDGINPGSMPLGQGPNAGCKPATGLPRQRLWDGQRLLSVLTGSPRGVSRASPGPSPVRRWKEYQCRRRTPRRNRLRAQRRADRTLSVPTGRRGRTSRTGDRTDRWVSQTAQWWGSSACRRVFPPGGLCFDPSLRAHIVRLLGSAVIYLCCRSRSRSQASNGDALSLVGSLSSPRPQAVSDTGLDGYFGDCDPSDSEIVSRAVTVKFFNRDEYSRYRHRRVHSGG